MSLYSRARDAKRAGIKAGIPEEALDVYQDGEKYGYRNKYPQDPELDALDDAVEDMSVEHIVDTKPCVVVEEEKPVEKPAPQRVTIEEAIIDLGTRIEPTLETCTAIARKAGLDVKPIAAPKLIVVKPVRPIIEKSTVESPTKFVWNIADAMLTRAVGGGFQITRRMILDECAKQGVATFTARTQVQAWLTAHRNSGTDLSAMLLRGS